MCGQLDGGRRMLSGEQNVKQRGRLDFNWRRNLDQGERLIVVARRRKDKNENETEPLAVLRL